MGSITFKTGNLSITLAEDDPKAVELQEAIDAGKQWEYSNGQIIIIE